MTLSRVVDPLILSASFNYTHFLPRRTARGVFKPGHVATVTPGIGFAVNPYINISWGMGLSYKMGDNDKLAKQPQRASTVLSTLNLGLGYRLAKDKPLNIKSRAGVVRNDATQLSTGLSQRF